MSTEEEIIAMVQKVKDEKDACERKATDLFNEVQRLKKGWAKSETDCEEWKQKALHPAQPAALAKTLLATQVYELKQAFIQARQRIAGATSPKDQYTIVEWMDVHPALTLTPTQVEKRVEAVQGVVDVAKSESRKSLAMIGALADLRRAELC